MASLSRKKLERIRAARLGDLRHMLVCIESGRLPGYEDRCDYLKQLLMRADKLPTRDEVKRQLRLRNDDRVAHRLYNTPPIDLTKAQLAEMRKQRNRERKRLARREAGAQLRGAYLAQFQKPWIAEGISRRTWYRRKANGGTGSSAPQLDQNGTGSSAPHTGSGTGSSAGNTYKQRTDLCHSRQAEPPMGQQEGVLRGPSANIAAPTNWSTIGDQFSVPRIISPGSPLNAFLLGTTALTPVRGWRRWQ